MNILIVYKHSKLEWDSINYNLSTDETIKKYIKEKINYKTILNSHIKQINVREEFKKIFSKSEFVSLEKARYKSIDNNYDLVLVLSGDNGFSLVSHYLKSTPVLGINSDPDRSVGCLTRYSIKSNKDVSDLYQSIYSKNTRTELWTRIKAEVNGKEITPATSEYFLGERLRKNMSRHIISYRGQEVEQKCSGLIIATGCGSTGWYRSSIGKDCLETEWHPTAKKAAFSATEQYQPLSKYNLIHNTFEKIGIQPNMKYGTIQEDEEIKIYSLNDADGHISIDSWEDYSFTMGSVARICIGEPLKVIIPNG